MKISIILKSSYGRVLAYPANGNAETFAAMLRAKTLTRDALEHIKALGFEIEATGGLAIGDVQ